MDIVTSQHLRDNWRRCREAAAYEDKVFVVTYYGDIPIAVLLSPQTWRRGLERVPHAGHTELGVRESRTALRRVFNAARHGTHTLITLHGEENAVIVPYRWTQEALPELIEDAGQNTGQQATGRTVGSVSEPAMPVWMREEARRTEAALADGTAPPARPDDPAEIADRIARLRERTTDRADEHQPGTPG